MSVLCIPAECDNIKLPFDGEIASRWDAYMLCAICRHFASLITHNLRCIPAYTHLIPTGFSSAIIIMPQMECAPLTSIISNLYLTSI